METETIDCHDRGEQKTLPVTRRLENGYVIAQDTTLIDDGTYLKNDSFCLVNPDGKILIHANDAESLRTCAANPEILERIERTGSVSE